MNIQDWETRHMMLFAQPETQIYSPTLELLQKTSMDVDFALTVFWLSCRLVYLPSMQALLSR